MGVKRSRWKRRYGIGVHAFCIVLRKVARRAMAAPLKRASQRLVRNPLATKLLDGTVRDGDHVVIDVGKQGLTFAATNPPTQRNNWSYEFGQPVIAPP